MPNIRVFQQFGYAPASVSIANVSTLAVAANTDRVGLVLTNTSSGTMYLSFGSNTAVLNAGIVLLPNGGGWAMDDYSYTPEQINAIGHTSGGNLAIQEFFR